MRGGAVVALLSLCACATSGLSGTPLETDFGGTWAGTATLALIGGTTVPYSVAFNIEVSGNTAHIASVCPGSVQHESLRQSNMRLPTEAARSLSSSVNATGSGASASWSGILECPKIELTGCAATAVTYTNATMTLTGSNQLTIVATGNAEGCGISHPLILTFVGAKWRG